MAWQQLTSIKGPQGEQGPTGATGPKGDTGAKGDQGLPGLPGEDGAGIEIAGAVDTYAQLPTNLTNTATHIGDGYLVRADGKLYIWDGDSFPANGSGVEFRGPTGLTGATGAKGDTGTQGATGPKGDQGIQGVKGDTGAQGPSGTAGARGTQWFTGNGAPPASIPGSAAGDLYLDATSGVVYKLS